jgi:hypothetical protein
MPEPAMNRLVKGDSASVPPAGVIRTVDINVTLAAIFPETVKI